MALEVYQSCSIQCYIMKYTRICYDPPIRGQLEVGERSQPTSDGHTFSLLPCHSLVLWLLQGSSAIGATHGDNAIFGAIAALAVFPSDYLPDLTT